MELTTSQGSHELRKSLMVTQDPRVRRMMDQVDYKSMQSKLRIFLIYGTMCTNATKFNQNLVLGQPGGSLGAGQPAGRLAVVGTGVGVDAGLGTCGTIGGGCCGGWN